MPRQPKDPQQPKRKKAIHGGGTVYQRKDGRYVASIKDPNSGKRIERYAKNEKEAEKKLEDIKFEIRQGTLATGPNQTVQQYLTRWFEDVHKQEVRETTYIQNRVTLNKHLIPGIGHIQLKKLTAQHIQRFYAEKIKEGCTASRVRGMHQLLHKALKNAARWKLIQQNVCDQVTVPRDTNKPETARILTEDQALLLLKASQGHPLEAFIALALVTGLRHGELMALRWQDINFEAKSLKVNHTVTLVWGHGYIENEPKTSTSKREIMLPQFVINSLLRHRARQERTRLLSGDKWQETGLVFCNRYGTYRDPSTTNKSFHRLLERNGLPSIRIHDLRHSAASLHIMVLNTPPKLVQELLGHSNIEMTLDVYTHANKSQQRQMMDAFDTFLGENW
jgi:integrase